MSQRYDADQIAAATGGRVLRPGPTGPIGTDTRSLTAGSWFLALSGPTFDGHRFLSVAAERGAAGAIVSRPPGRAWTAGAVLVDDTERALQALGRDSRERFAGPVVGLTGSSGKTTTRALCALALQELGPVHATEGNLNNHLGVPLTLLARPDDAAAMVVELGTSAPGEIELLCHLAIPTIRLIVNVGPAHLEELGGLDGVAREKGALFRTARPGDVLCVNGDDPFVRALPIPDGVRVVTWGRAGDIALVEAQVDATELCTTATWSTPAGTLRARIPAPGVHIAHDAAGALAVAHALGLDLHRAVEALRAYEPVGMRLRRESLPCGAVALNDTYNANPQSVEASLRMLAELGGRRVAVLGDMMELGLSEAPLHEQTAALATSLGLDLVVLVGPRMSAARSAAPGALAFADPVDAVEPLRAWLRAEDTALFKGSRGARVERVLQLLQAAAPRGAS